MRYFKPMALAAIILVILCIPAFSFNASTPPDQRNVILFSWDGAQREHLKDCLSRKELPNLSALISEGKLVNIDVIGHTTDTKAGHTQMLTGYEPTVTGVYGNIRFRAIPEGVSIFEKIEKAIGDDKITTIMLTGKDHHIGSLPPSTKEQIDTAKAKYKKLTPERKAKAIGLKTIINNTAGEPWNLVKKNIDVWDGDKQRPNTEVGPLELGYLDKYGKGRFFAFFHYRDPDYNGHITGENSKEYNDAIIACDKWLGETVKKLKELGIYDKTIIFVTADHGFDEGKKTHSKATTVFLASNTKSLVKDGDQKDIVPTILTEMGVDYSKAEPKLSGKVLTETK